MYHCDKHNLTTTGINCPYCETTYDKLAKLEDDSLRVRHELIDKNMRENFHPPTESWIENFNELYWAEGTTRDMLLDFISSLLSQAEARHRESTLKLIEGMKKTRKPTHGPCCTCQECGYNIEDGNDCECARNRILDEVIKYLKE